MKITKKTDLPTILSSKLLNPYPDSDLLLKPTSKKPPSRRCRNPAGVRVKRDGGPVTGRRSRPDTPLLQWKLIESKEKDNDDDDSVQEEEEKCPADVGRKSGRKGRGGGDVVVSVRKLAAGLWRLQLPEVANGGEMGRAPRNDRLGFQSTINHPGIHSPAHRNRKLYDTQVEDPVQSPLSVSGPRNGFLRKHEPSFHFSNSEMEGATKWDPGCWKVSEEVNRIYGRSKPLEQQVGVVSIISALKLELEQAQSRINELENERRSSKKKLEHFLKKLSEERTIWRSREHEKIRAVIDDIKDDLNRERKNRQRMEIVNSKLVNELADIKLSAKRYMQEYEKERKARELIEEVCDELAKEIGEDKAEIEALKRESSKMREEVEDERKMLQMAEVWREERVQMKLVDAKVSLEEKYSQMNKLVADLEAFLSSKGAILNAEETRTSEILRQAAASVSIQEMKDFTYEPPKSDDIFAVFEDFNIGETNIREIEACPDYSPASHGSKIHTVTPEAGMFKKDGIQRHSNLYFNQNDNTDLEEDEDEDEDDDDDESGWETVSHVEDQGSSYSPNGSDPSVNNMHRKSNVSYNGIEWKENTGAETPITEISEVCNSVPTKEVKKVSSISRLWRSHQSNGDNNYKTVCVEGMNGRRQSNARLSYGVLNSPGRGSCNGGSSPPDLTEQWSSPDSGHNPHITRGMKGCIEWPRGSIQKHSLKSKLMEARMESQKMQLRQVLKQKI